MIYNSVVSTEFSGVQLTRQMEDKYKSKLFNGDIKFKDLKYHTEDLSKLAIFLSEDNVKYLRGHFKEFN